MIELVQVSKRYGGARQPAVQDVSFRVGAGEFCLLTGPSGAGKSTVLRMLFRADIPTDGRVLVGGEDVGRMRPRHVPALRRTIGVVFQDFRLLRDATVAENIAVALEVQGRPWREIESRVGAMLERVGLAHKSSERIAALSGGEQQRVAIARALVGEPALLLCDEPTGNLDDERARSIAALLDDAHARGTTVLVATHDPNLFGGSARRILRMDDGRVVADAGTSSVGPAASAHGSGDAVVAPAAPSADPPLVHADEAARSANSANSANSARDANAAEADATAAEASSRKRRGRKLSIVK